MLKEFILFIYLLCISYTKDGVFNYRFTTNLLLSLSVKEFSKSVTFAKVTDESIVAAFFQNTMHTAFFQNAAR